MDLIADRGRRVTIEELNTTRLLSHARKQAHQRNLDDMVIVDVDAHHYENESYDEYPAVYGERRAAPARAVEPQQEQSRRHLAEPGRLSGHGRPRHPLSDALVGKDRGLKGAQRDIQLGHRWMDAMSVDYSCLFPTGMLNIGLHPQKEMEVELCWAYNRWLTEKVMPEGGNRFFSMLCLPFNTPEAALRHVEEFGDRPNVGGFMVTTVRSDMAVYDNAYMKLYRALEERGLVLSFHSGPNWGEPIYKSCNRFLAAHALGFTWYNVVHCTNWVINGMGERFPKLPVIWIESGLAWVPFLMQRLDHEFMLRPSEAPLLKKKPSRLYARHVLLVAADGDPGLRRDGVHLPHDECRDAAPVLLRLSALGLRPAVDDLRSAVPVGEGQAQYPRRHRGAAVQAAAAQRQAERESRKSSAISPLRRDGARMHKHAIRIDRTKPLAAEPHCGHNRYHPDIAPVTRSRRGRGSRARNARRRRRPDRAEHHRRRSRELSMPAASIR